MATPLEAFVVQFENIVGIRPETYNVLTASLAKELEPLFRIRETPEFRALLKSMEESMRIMLDEIRVVQQSPAFKEMDQLCQPHCFAASDWLASINRPLLVSRRPSPAPKPKPILGFLGGVAKPK